MTIPDHRKIAGDLFLKLVDSIRQAAEDLRFENKASEVLWRTVEHVRLSTSERGQEDLPEKDIFFLRFIHSDRELPENVGIGSLKRNQIFLDSRRVPKELWMMLHDLFKFSVIAVEASVKELKEEDLSAWFQPAQIDM